MRRIILQEVDKSLCSFSCDTDELFLRQVLYSDVSSIRIILSQAQGNVHSLGRNSKRKFSLKYRWKQVENVTTWPYFPSAPSPQLIYCSTFFFLSNLFMSVIQEGKVKCCLQCIVENCPSFIKPPLSWVSRGRHSEKCIMKMRKA